MKMKPILLPLNASSLSGVTNTRQLRVRPIYKDSSRLPTPNRTPPFANCSLDATSSPPGSPLKQPNIAEKTESTLRPENLLKKMKLMDTTGTSLETEQEEEFTTISLQTSSSDTQETLCSCAQCDLAANARQPLIDSTTIGLAAQRDAAKAEAYATLASVMAGPIFLKKLIDGGMDTTENTLFLLRSLDRSMSIYLQDILNSGPTITHSKQKLSALISKFDLKELWSQVTSI